MSSDIIAKAFDPFFTTKPIGPGTGLGLSMIYGFAKQSGGQVRVHSREGQGTTLSIYLPRYRGDLSFEHPPAIAQVECEGAGETILIVDDEPTVRLLLAEVLTELGYTLIEAADSIEGLKVLSADTSIDLLITDVGLPGGMNGRQMADAARQDRPDLEVLFITGYAENAAIGEGQLDSGMHVLTKPFAMQTLTSKVRELISAQARGE